LQPTSSWPSCLQGGTLAPFPLQLYRLWCGIPRPATLQCDNGGEFKAAVASAAQLFNIRIINSSVGNPQAQGAVERTNRSFKDMLRALLLECPTIYWSFQASLVHSAVQAPSCSTLTCMQLAVQCMWHMWCSI